MGWVDSLTASLLVSLRLVPTLAFAQPFTLLRVPVLVRMMIAVGLALWLVDARPAQTVDRLGAASMVGIFTGELAIGLSIALSLQLAFAAILWAGRVLDVQAGFGLALLTDPTTQNNQPLVGTVLAYAAAIIFMTTGGLYDLLSLWMASVETLPLGYGAFAPDMAALGSYMGSVFFLAVGLIGAAMMALFLTDVVIGFMSRTLPQMNMLLLGFQVKAMVLLVTLPLAIAFSGALYVRIIRLALEAPSTWWGVR